MSPMKCISFVDFDQICKQVCECVCVCDGGGGPTYMLFAYMYVWVLHRYRQNYCKLSPILLLVVVVFCIIIASKYFRTCVNVHSSEIRCEFSENFKTWSECCVLGDQQGSTFSSQKVRQLAVLEDLSDQILKGCLLFCWDCMIMTEWLTFLF